MFVFASVFGAGCLVACSACSVVHVWPGVELGVEALTSGRSGSRVVCYIQLGLVWSGIFWNDMVLHGMAFYGLVLAKCTMVWHGLAEVWKSLAEVWYGLAEVW